MWRAFTRGLVPVIDKPVEKVNLLALWTKDMIQILLPSLLKTASLKSPQRGWNMPSLDTKEQSILWTDASFKGNY